LREVGADVFDGHAKMVGKLFEVGVGLGVLVAGVCEYEHQAITRDAVRRENGANGGILAARDGNDMKGRLQSAPPSVAGWLLVCLV